jgi:hypothetical protein
MRLVKMKPIQGLFWAKKYRLLKIVSMGADAGIQMTCFSLL